MSHACGNPRCHGLRCESAEPSYDQATEKERATDMTTRSCAGSISELWRGVLTIHTSRTNSCSNNPPHSHHENLHRTLDPQTQLVQWSLGLDPYSSMLQKPKHQQLSSGCSSSPQPTDELVEKSLNLILVIVSKRGVNMLKIQLILFWDVIMHYNLKLQSSKPCQKGVGADVDQW